MREKGEREGEDDGGWRRPRRASRPNDNHNLVSFFFTGIPETHREEHLWPIFQRYGKVWEVFIPNKRDRMGKRFGFVRYHEVDDQARLGRQLDNIMIGNTKLYVNVPRFGRNGGVQRNQYGNRVAHEIN